MTKFIIPLLRAQLLPRAPLIKRLNQNCTLPLVLLSAGAGFGKTTLLAAWTTQSPSPVAWLSLDLLDNDPHRFWSAIVTALRTRLPTVGEAALAQLHSPQPSHLVPLLTSLINDLVVLGEEVVLIVDDYHVIEEQAIHESLVFLLDHAPPCLHLVIASRVDPPLALSRWRVRGQMAEIRDPELRLSEGETAGFLGEVMGLHLGKEEVRRLTERTEGWIAGLQLAALSLRGHADPSAFVNAFSGSQRLILDYVQEEILAQQPLPIQRFLLQTSVLTRMHASLCQTVTGEQASVALLERLERANLFLSPLDEERRWYRSHDLFREAMLARLQATQPEMIPILHQRAARWYEEQREFREAIFHQLSAQDFSSAARLMEQTARQFWMRGEISLLFHWVMELPDAVAREHTNLMLTTALYLLNTNYFSIGKQRITFSKEAEQLMIRVETTLRQSEEEALTSMNTKLLQQRLRLLHTWKSVFDLSERGNREQLRLVYQQVQDLEEDEDVAWQIIPLFISCVFHHLSQREGGSLVPRLQDAWQQVSQSGDHFAMIEVKRWLAFSYLRAGKLRQVHQECLTSLALLEQVQGYIQMADYFFMCLGLVFYEWNQLEEARNALWKVIHEAALWQHEDLLAWGYRILVKVELAANNRAAARQALQKAEKKAQQTSVFHRSWVVGARVLCWLAAGNLTQASNWAAHIVFNHNTWEPHHYEEFLALIRVYLAQQRYVQAVQTLEDFRSHFDLQGDITGTISFLSLYVVALWQAGMSEQARTVVLRLLALTQAEGHIRTYLDASSPMQQVLQSLLAAPPEDEESISAISRSTLTTLLAAFEQEEHRQAFRLPLPVDSREGASLAPPQEISPRLVQSLPTPASKAPDLIEPPTAQELRVLRLLAEGASNQQIADQLAIELSTAKKHVSNLLSKLGAANRTQAIVRARQSSLL